MLVEFGVGFWTGSLALLSDAAHMGTDVLGLGMALTAIRVAARPRTKRRTFGLHRLEVLAALGNGLLLFGVAGYVLFEALHRLSHPPTVPGVPLIATAVIGLAINLVSMRLLSHGQSESINVRGAYLEVMADMIGSLGVIASAAITIATGWRYADPIMGVAIGMFILPRTWKLLKNAVTILLEVAPPHVDMISLENDMLSIPEVDSIHDLHVWTITSGNEALSGHVRLAAKADGVQVLQELRALLHERHNIDHVTIQCESASFGSERGVC